MEISNEMVAKAQAVAPALTDGVVRSMLEAALSGQVVMVANEGQHIVDGKSLYPDYMQIEVADRYTILSLAQQLIATLQGQPNAATLEHPALLMLAGKAGISYDD